MDRRPGSGLALLRAYARYLSALGDRLDLAPEKSRLAFLDLLGVSLLPAQPARAPVVFTLPPGGGDTRAPAGSQVAASVAGRPEPLVFETEADTGLCAARLVEVASVWPGRDAWADHGSAARSGTSFRLFDPLTPVPHEIYLGHRTLLALSGSVTVEITLELAQVASTPMDTVWEYWDGEGWRAFSVFEPVATAISSDSVDGTLGLTRSGTVRLVAECSSSQVRNVAGVESHWVRGRLVATLPPNVAGARPTIDRVRLRSVVAPSMGVITLAGPDGGREKQVWVSSFGLSSQGIDLSDAFAVLSDPSKPEEPFPSQSLASGSAQWDGVENGDYTLQVTVPGYTTLVQTISPTDDASNYFLGTDFSGLSLDKAVNEGLPVDLTTTLFPFGQNPQTGSIFAVSFAEALTKPGATVTLRAAGAQHRPTHRRSDGRHADVADPDRGGGVLRRTRLGRPRRRRVDHPEPVPDHVQQPAHLHRARRHREHRDRRGGRTVGPVPDQQPDLRGDPDDEVEGLRPGRTTTSRSSSPGLRSLGSLRGGYVYRSPQVTPECCLTHNDFSFTDVTEQARDRGAAFEPFSPVRDTTPTVYFGFDGRLPADVISMYLDIAETEGLTSGPGLVWEHWDGTAWVPVSVRDETAGFVLPGMVSVVSPGTAPPPTATVLTAALGLGQPGRRGRGIGVPGGGPGHRPLRRRLRDGHRGRRGRCRGHVHDAARRDLHPRLPDPGRSAALRDATGVVVAGQAAHRW